MKIKQCATDEYLQLQKISIENNKINKGNLGYTFFEMINLLTLKYNIEPLVIKLINEEYDLIGYAIFYFSDSDTIQISQICLKRKYQNNNYASYLITELKQDAAKITADIAKDNIQSQNFFIKEGFSIEEVEDSKRYRAIFKH